MTFRTGAAAAAISAAMLAATAAGVHAAEGGFLEMLFGVRPQPQVQPQAEPAPMVSERRARVGDARHRLRTRYAALPVKIRIGEKDEVSPRQPSIDMRGGAAAAFLKDATLQPGDIVILKSGAHVFKGDPDGRHAMRDFEPASRSSYVSKATRRHLADMLAPVGALPADAARRMVARARKAPAPAQEPAAVQAAAMRVINPWVRP